MSESRGVVVLAKAWSLLGGERHKYVALIALNVVGRVCYLAAMLFMAAIVESTMSSSYEKVLVGLAFLLGTRFIGLFSGWLYRVAERRVWASSVTRLRGFFMDKLDGMKTHIVDSYMNSDLFTRFKNDLEGIVSFFGKTLALAFADLILMICVFTYLGTIDLRLWLIAVALFPVMVLVCVKKGKEIEQDSERVQNAKAAINGLLTDVFQHREEVKSFKAERFFTRKAEDEMSDTLKSELRLFFDERIVWATEILIYAAFNFLYFASGAILAFFGDIPVSGVVGLMLLNGCLVDILFSLPSRFSSFKAELPKMNRYFEILETPGIIRKSERQYDRSEENSVRIENLGFSYGGSPVLEGIDLSIPRGQKVLIVGPSGSGKSTLLRLLAGYSSEYTGSIQIDGEEISKLADDEVRVRVSFLPQDVRLFPATIAENVAMFTDVEDAALRDAIFEAADFSTMTIDLKEMPEGERTMVQPEMSNLSKGQVQRIGWMVCRMKEAELILVDEGFSSISPASSTYIIDKLAAEGEKTVVLTSHVMNSHIESRFDRIIRLEGGRIQEDREISVHGRDVTGSKVCV